MKGCILLLVCFALLSMVLCAATEDAVHETALFMKNAWDAEGSIGYWGGDAEHPRTFFLYLRDQLWSAGSETLRREGATLLGCVAPMIRTLVRLGGTPLPTELNAPYAYQLKVLPPPPGGAPTTVAEGLVQPGDCAPSRAAQRLLLHLLFPEKRRQSL
jgi:hypothetical protein